MNARGMEAQSGETRQGLDPKGDSPVPTGTRPEKSAPQEREALAADIKAAIAELADGKVFPDLIAAIDRLAALSQPPAAAQREAWISVEDRMPEPDTECLVWLRSPWAQ